MNMWGRLFCLAAALLVAPSALAQEAFVPWRPTVTIQRVSRAPTLEDFLDMEPSSDLVDELTKVSGFIQREPSDGEPSKELTDVYLGYDEENLYVIFVAFDREPDKVRARMGRRESIDRDDDLVWINMDTFNDERRGMVFQCNPYGIQRDSLFVSGVGEDASWDTLWYSRGERTDQGYVVWIALPFKSLRFSNEDQQTWGLLLERWIPRNNDWSFWPQASSRIEGFFNQTGYIEMENISPGRNIQLIPYAASRSFRALDPELPGGPDFVEDFRDISVGLDAKFLIQDSLTLDATANPKTSRLTRKMPYSALCPRSGEPGRARFPGASSSVTRAPIAQGPTFPVKRAPRSGSAMRRVKTRFSGVWKNWAFSMKNGRLCMNLFTRQALRIEPERACSPAVMANR